MSNNKDQVNSDTGSSSNASVSTSTTTNASTGNRKKSWCHEEDRQLCKSWLHISLDEYTGQSSDSLWQRITDHFNEFYDKKRKPNDCERSRGGLASRWNFIHPRVNIFCLAVEEAKKLRTSENKDIDITRKARELYIIKWKKERNADEVFKLDHCYQELCDDIKWKEHMNAKNNKNKNISVDTPQINELEDQSPKNDTTTKTPEDNHNRAPEDNSTKVPGDNTIITPSDNTTKVPENNITKVPENNTTKAPEDNVTKASKQAAKRKMELAEEITENQARLLDWDAKRIKLQEEAIDIKIMSVNIDSCFSPVQRSYFRIKQALILKRLKRELGEDAFNTLLQKTSTEPGDEAFSTPENFNDSN